MKIKSKITIEEFKQPYGVMKYWVVWRVTGFAEFIIRELDSERAARRCLKEIKARAKALEKS